ncbi:MAG: methylmalonyl-CoA epimerase [Rubrobacteraceae bacterium]
MLKGIHHLGYAVEDLKAAARFYRESFGAEVGEPEIVEAQGLIAAMVLVGDSRIELLQPTRPDSPVGKFLEKRGEGFHHTAFEVNDIGAALRDLAGRVELIDTEPRSGASGTQTAFVHPKAAFGVLTELVELPRGAGSEEV